MTFDEVTLSVSPTIRYRILRLQSGNVQVVVEVRSSGKFGPWSQYSDLELMPEYVGSVCDAMRIVTKLRGT